MDILIRLLIALEAIVCLLLVGIVLIQRSKGQGVGLSFGGGAEAVFGAQMGNVLTRATVILAIIFLLNTTILAVLKPTTRGGSLAERAPVKPVERVEVPATSEKDAAEAMEFLETEAAEMAIPAAGVEKPVVDTEAVKEAVPVSETPVVEVPVAEGSVTEEKVVKERASVVAKPSVEHVEQVEKTDDGQ